MENLRSTQARWACAAETIVEFSHTRDITHSMNSPMDPEWNQVSPYLATKSQNQ